MRTAPLLFAALLLSGCGLIEVNRVDVQQGNDLEPREIGALEVGMTRTQVIELLGRPVLDTPFHADRWEYVYYETEAGSDPETPPRRLTLFFRDDAVSRIVDRFGPTTGP